MVKHHSLKRRLLGLVLTVIVSVWMAAAILTYHDAHEEFDEILDAHLVQSASLLVLQATQNLDVNAIEHAPMLHKYSRKVAFQIWSQGQVLRLHSINSPSEPFANVDHGFSDSEHVGHRWRVFSTWDATHQYLIHVAERSDERDELANAVVENLLKPILVSLPLLAVLLWWAVAQALRPLADLAREVGQREPDNLTALDAASSPKEVAPLMDKLNQLFARIGDFVQKERRFTADAAHELRTPVAAIKAQAQVAKGATEDIDRLRALDNAILGCDRAAHLIDQLLTLARIDALSDELVKPCQLNNIATEVITLIAPVAVEKNVSVELKEGVQVIVHGDAAMLSILLRNLIDNSVRHTPAGTTVSVEVATRSGRGSISVSDDGPGIPEEEREKITERFYRPLGTKASGSGLGLSIVKRVVEIHQATLNITSANGKGLKVEVLFKQ